MPFLVYTPAQAHERDSVSGGSKWFDDYRKQWFVEAKRIVD
jgi:rubredoxin